jgi:intein/homing endonuclease
MSYYGDLKKDRKYMKHISRLVFKLFNTKPNILVHPSKNSICLRLRSKKLFSFYMSLGIPSGTKKRLVIPKFIRNSKFYLCSFLRGLFDTDGCVTFQKFGKYKYPLVKITNKDLAFSKDLVIAFNSLKIPSFLTIKKYKNKDYYDVVIRNKNVYLFSTKIGSNNPNNIKKLTNIN